jgi:uncharacterized membrane protein YkoI
MYSNAGVRCGIPEEQSPLSPPFHLRFLVCSNPTKARRSRMKRKLALIVALVLALGAVSAGIAVAAGAGGGDDKPLTGSTLAKAKAAALEHTGGGTVTETEVGDDGAAYGVEVRLADGSQVEVSLDENFEVINQATDDDGATDEGETNDD